MTSPLLIGLAGKARSGKDTAGGFLSQHYDIKPYSFAAPLKKMLTSVFGDLFYGGDRESVLPWLGKSPRQLMQTLGTEWGRHQVHEDLWWLLAKRRWEEAQFFGEPGLVITDVRFDSEAKHILAAGGLLIEIIRPDRQQVSEHQSENGLSPGIERVYVHNDGTFEQFEYNLVSVVEQWKVSHAR